MKNKEEKEKVKDNEIPLASMIINEYKGINKQLKETNDQLQKSNKRISIMALILLVLFAIETTYIVLYWDSMHPHAGAIREDVDEWNMYKIPFTKRELEKIEEEVHFTPMQKRIIRYRLDEESRVKMADLEKVSVATIDREIKEVVEKIKRAYDKNLITFW